MMPPATEQQYFWMIDGHSKELDNKTSPVFDAVIKILRCQAAIVITDQSDMQVSLDLPDVFQRRGGGGHCVRLEPFSRLTGAHSQTHSLTAIINTIGQLTTGTSGTTRADMARVNYTGR